MTEFHLKTDKEGRRMYLKEEIAKILKSTDGKEIIGLANAETVLLYPDGTNYETVLESLEVLKKDLELRKKRQQTDSHEPSSGDINGQLQSA